MIVRGGIDTGITFNMSFLEVEAAIAAGATLDQLNRWRTGGYTRDFKAFIIAWYNTHRLIELHTQDAVERHSKSKSKSRSG